MKKISLHQFSSLIIFSIFSSFFGIGIYSAFKAGKIDAPIGIIISIIFSLFIVFLITYIANYQPDLTIGEKIKKLYGKKIGTILNFILILFIGATSLSFIFNLGHFIITQFLSETSIYAIEIVFGILIIYINIKGLNTISKTSQILFFISILLFITSLLSLIPHFMFNNLKPILKFGLNNSFNAGTRIFLLNYVPLFSILIIPKNKIDKKEKYNKNLLIMVLISGILLLTLTVMTLGVLGIDLARIYQYPEYIMLKKIVMFQFIDQIENFINLQWIFGLFILIAFSVYSINKIIVEDKKSNVLPFIITIILTVLTNLLFKNITIFNYYIYNIAPYIRLAFLIFMIFITISIFIKTKFTKYQ